MTALVKYDAAAVQDSDAAEIGKLYRKAKASIVDSVQYLIDAGRRLTAKKDSLKHGEWLPWLEANVDALGFGERSAQLLIRGAATANAKSTSDLTEAEATQIS